MSDIAGWFYSLTPLCRRMWMRKWMIHFEFLDPDVRSFVDGSRLWRVNLRINGRFIGIALTPGSRFVGRWGKGTYWINPWGWPRNWR